MYGPIEARIKYLTKNQITTTLNDIMISTLRLYTHVIDCEKDLMMISAKNITTERFSKNLRIQSSDGLMNIISKKLSEVLGLLPDYTYEQVNSFFCTFSWVKMRMARAQDWWDVHSILDYITRVHYGKPCAALIFDIVFDTQALAEAQSMDWSILKDLVSGYKSLKTHPVAIKFMKVVSLAFSGGVLATLGIESQMVDLWKIVSECMTKIIGHTDFISAVLDLFHFIIERVSAFCITKSWKSLLHTPSSYTKWADASFDCLDKSVALANPEAIGVDYHKYTSDLIRLIAQGEEIKRYVRAADEKDAVSQLLSRLRVLYNDILIKNACGKFRMAPFGILLSAGSGVGKSSFTAMLLSHFGNLYDKPIGDEFIYTRTPSEEHWNNFKTCMWGCILDDIAFINPNKGTCDPSLSDLLQAMNNPPFSPPQAAIEDKGRTPFKCDIVVATTNTEDLKAHNWYNNPQAVRRRLPYVVNLLPKKEYRIDGTRMLDPSKVPVLMPGFYPDLWDIVVKKVLVEPNQTVSMHVVLETSDIYIFIQAYNGWLEEHRRGQAAFMAAKAQTMTVKLCSLHKIPITVCPCEDTTLLPQGLEEDLSLQGAHLSVGNTLMSGAVAYATYKGANLAAECAGDVLLHDPSLIERPAHLISATTNRMCQKVQWSAGNALSRMTREGIKKILKGAYYGILDSIKPYLKYLMISVATVAGLGLTWRMMQKEFPELTDQVIQVNIDEVGVMPERSQDKENVWRKDDYVATEFVGRLSQSWASIPFTQACSLVARNTVWCQTTHRETKHMTFRATCVAGHLYVVPNHVLPIDEYFMLQVISQNTTEGCNGNVRFKISQRCIYRVPELELAFFEINHMPVRRNLLELFPKDGFRCDGPGRMIVRQPNGSMDYIDTKRTHIVPQSPVEQFNIIADVAVSHVTRDTLDGECGSITLVQQPNACYVAGIHVLGGQRNVAISMPVTTGVIEGAIKHFSTPVVETEIPYLNEQTFTTDISQKCTARFVETGTLEVFGSFGGFKHQPKSTARDTLFTKHLLAKGYTKKFGPAPMKGYTALHIGLKSMVQKTMTFKEDVLRKCSDSYTKSVWSALPTRYRQELREVLPLKVALNGLPGTKFIDSMNFGTSAGYPYNKSKRNYVTCVPADDIWQHPIEVDETIKAEISACWDKMCQGISVGPVFMEHMKDEALPLRKVKAGKARLFMGGPFGWSVCVRMALLPFVRVMQINKYLFECAPGTNATSIEWTRLYTYLTQHGEMRMIAGDFEAFDKLMGALIILEAFRIIRNIMRLSGATEGHINCIQVIAEDVAFAFVNFNGDLMRFFGSNPSGHPLTVIINCLVNSLYMRYCYHELNEEKEVDSFKQNVSLITYGDDNAMGSGVDWFNHTAIAEVLSTVGVKYTMADKLAISVPFIPITEVSFLKRTFRWEPRLQSYMATLDIESIWKSLMIFVPSSTDSPQKQCLDIVRSAVSEWFFYGEERFDKECAFLKELITDADLTCYIEKGTFPTWSELASRYLEASNDYLSSEPMSTIRLVGECHWAFKCDCTDHKIGCPHLMLEE